MHQLMKCIGDIQPFLENPELIASSATKMILEDPPKLRKLQMELAVMVDAMEPFVKATYLLEGDGVLALKAYEQFDALQQFIALEHYPNVTAIAKQLSGRNSVHELHLSCLPRECVKPAYQYFKQNFGNELKHLVEAFKAAQFFSPSRVSTMKPRYSFTQLFSFS